MRYVCFIAIILLFSCREKCDTEAVQRKYDSLETVNGHLRSLEKSYLTEIDTLSKKASEIRTKVIYLNKNRDAKIKVVDTMSDSDIDSFLTNVKTD